MRESTKGKHERELRMKKLIIILGLLGVMLMYVNHAEAQDQFSEVIFTGSYVPTVRSSGNNDGISTPLQLYFLNCSSSGSSVIKLTTFNNLPGQYFYEVVFSTINQYAVGDVARITVIGTTITAYKNGAFNGSGTDSSISTGSPGLSPFLAGDPTTGSQAIFQVKNMSTCRLPSEIRD
jgi:hypothetical protein